MKNKELDNMFDIYYYAKMVAGRYEKAPITKRKPYMLIGCDMAYDLENPRYQYDSQEEYIDDVYYRCRDKYMNDALKHFLRNYRNWKRNRQRPATGRHSAHTR